MKNLGLILKYWELIVVFNDVELEKEYDLLMVLFEEININ